MDVGAPRPLTPGTLDPPERAAVIAALVAAPLGLLAVQSMLLAVGVLVAAGAGVACVQHPRGAVVWLALLLALQLPVLAFALEQGVPTRVVDNASLIRSVIVIGLVVAALRTGTAGRNRLDRLDRIGVAYIGLVAAYVAVTLTIERIVGGVFPRAPRALSWQLIAFRAHTAGVAILLAARSLGPDGRLRRAVTRVVLVTGALLAAGAVVEIAATDLWTRVVEDHLGLRRFYSLIFNVTRENIVQETVVRGRTLTRAGSLLFDDLQLGFLLLPAFGILLARVARRGRGAGLVALTGAGIVLTLTRSAIIGLTAAVVTVMFLVEPGRNRRTRLTVLALIAGVGLVLVAGPIGLTDRAATAVDPDQPSTESHLDSLEQGLETVVANPLGLGPGTGPSVADRRGGFGITTENSYLGLAAEFGVPTAVVFLALIVVLIRRLAAVRPRDDLTVGATAAGVGLALGAFFLHVWTMLAATWLFFLVAGVALPRRGGGAGRPH